MEYYTKISHNIFEVGWRCCHICPLKSLITYSVNITKINVDVL